MTAAACSASNHDGLACLMLDAGSSWLAGKHHGACYRQLDFDAAMNTFVTDQKAYHSPHMGECNAGYSQALSDRINHMQPWACSRQTIPWQETLGERSCLPGTPGSSG